MHMKCSSVCLSAILSVVTVGTDTAWAGLVGQFTVGSGTVTSYLQFEFGNTNTYLYEVLHNGGVDGSDLISVVAAAQPGYFEFDTISYSFGDVLYEVKIGADTNAGFGTPPDYLDYWHYWTRDVGERAWTESFVGFSDRVHSDGSWDGWVFNSAAAPSAVPAPGVIALLALAGMRNGRSRRR
jgi:hypothetical protein